MHRLRFSNPNLAPDLSDSKRRCAPILGPLEVERIVVGGIALAGNLMLAVGPKLHLLASLDGPDQILDDDQSKQCCCCGDCARLNVGLLLLLIDLIDLERFLSANSPSEPSQLLSSHAGIRRTRHSVQNESSDQAKR